MKVSGIVLRTALILAVAMSLLMTWFIWLNPSRLEKRDATTPAVAIKTTDTRTAAAQESSVYLPTMAYYQHDGQKQMLYQDNQDVVTQVHKVLEAATLTKVEKSTKLDEAAFNELISSGENVQLMYADVMAFSLFKNQFFDHPVKTTMNFKFNRMLINLQAGTKTITLVNDATRQTYTGQVSGLKIAQLQKVATQYDTGGFELQEQRFGSRMVPLFTKAISIRPYTYLLDRQSVSHYIPILLTPNVNNQANVDARELGTETVYTVGTNLRLSVNNGSGDMEFENTAADTPSAATGKFFDQTFGALDKLNLPSLTTMRYFAYDTTKQAVTYRSYVQNFAIFNQTSNGTVQVTYNRNTLQVDFSGDNVTVPIPTNEKAVTLPSTPAILSLLVQKGYTADKIQNIMVGYHWVKQNQNDLVVDLQPTYYVQINGQIKEYSAWLDETTTQGGQ
ncbi:YycH family regulatory protein [Lacticaseibacillus brantae]|uniref:Regulatory protein YycH domain-containing protein n=1 Tax=Lacticaseibacillus brantae DSM 23927 TaxID=1423727 RepID=A0A0R2AWJ0_9LACO|nr:two-component system activity regulator YycH [Lacticaseibacillus brantae]KRM71629.1 hypothetical protein FC34_GL001286 [Lacticaseibacillus brantae DSM 23927]